MQTFTEKWQKNFAALFLLPFLAAFLSSAATGSDYLKPPFGRPPTPYKKVFISNDPIRFSIATSKSTVAVGEEIELTIRAELMNIPSSVLFLLEGSNRFRLKLLVPNGFEITGGSYVDYIGDALSFPAKPEVSYTVKGRFVNASDNCFRLLRSHGQADQSSIYAEKAKLCLSVKQPDQSILKNDRARVAETCGDGVRVAESLSSPVAGLRYSYYEHMWSRSVSEIEGKTPVAQAVVGQFSLAPRQKPDYFGFEYTGYINIP
ncbi:hypothetical protein, partial [Nibrella saemangeumensis]|uniref:hypothetical protein n=1 Tax=Nibrella saemangeumensis TaxID=1084526 RepID=UPI0031EE3973